MLLNVGSRYKKCNDGLFVLMAFVNAKNFNSTSDETKKMILGLCPNYNENNFKKYKGIFFPDDKDFFVTKIRIVAGGKTVYSMYMNKSFVKNPYFTVDLPGVKKDQNITIYCTDTKHPKEYIWEDKVEFSKKYQNMDY